MQGQQIDHDLVALANVYDLSHKFGTVHQDYTLTQ